VKITRNESDYLFQLFENWEDQDLLEVYLNERFIVENPQFIKGSTKKDTLKDLIPILKRENEK